MYHLTLSPKLASVQDVFHVSQLQKYILDPNHVISHTLIELNEDLTYEEQRREILDGSDKKLNNKVIRLVKVLWAN